MKLSGTVHKYGDNVDTDVIIPARYLNTFDPAELAKHCLEDLDPGFASRVRPGDILLAGSNFGCGSSREHAPLAIKSSGASGVVARSFARIFFRNAVNIGLPIFECPEAPDLAENGGRLEIELETGTIVDPASGATFRAASYTGFILDVIQAGGLIARLRQQAGRTNERA